MPFKPCHSIALIVLLLFSPAAGAAVETGKLTEGVREAKIIDASFPLEMRLDKKTLFVLTDRHLKATEQDCKIDAVLIGKEVFKTPELDSIVVVFKPRMESDTKQAWRVELTRKHVEHFAKGSMTKEALLDTIVLEQKEPRADALRRGPLADLARFEPPVPGPELEQRTAIYERLRLMQNRMPPAFMITLPMWQRLQQAAVKGDLNAVRQIARRMDHKTQVFTRRLEVRLPADNAASVNPESR